MRDWVDMFSVLTHPTALRAPKACLISSSEKREDNEAVAASADRLWSSVAVPELSLPPVAWSSFPPRLLSLALTSLSTMRERIISMAAVTAKEGLLSDQAAVAALMAATPRPPALLLADETDPSERQQRVCMEHGRTKHGEEIQTDEPSRLV